MDISDNDKEQVDKTGLRDKECLEKLILDRMIRKESL